MIRWPRGKYNGQRITGVTITTELDVDWTFWRPRASWNFGEPYLLWLWFGVRAKLAYSLREPKSPMPPSRPIETREDANG